VGTYIRWITDEFSSVFCTAACFGCLLAQEPPKQANEETKPAYFTTIQHGAPQFFEIHHKSSTNKFTSILTKLKCKNHHIATPSSLCRVVATVGSSCVWVQEVIGEVVSCPVTVL
jgi:hypothetical protein